MAARITIGFPVSEVVPIRLDETPEGAAVRVDGRRVETVVPPHGLRSLQLVCP